ncbi:MAG: tandem-95 repeat protein [bacterium]
MGIFGLASSFGPCLRTTCTKYSLYFLTLLMSFLCIATRLLAQTIQSEPVLVGYKDFNYTGGDVTSEPTEEKPESKLWYHDSFWWGTFWDNDVNKYKIFRLDMTTQDWTDTGTEVDSRPRSSQDVLSEGQTLYIASRAKQSHKDTHGSEVATLSRFTYNSVSNTYALDTGFPTDIPGTARTRALTLAKDSNGKLWVTWTANLKVMINRTIGGDTNWGTAFGLPVQGSDLNVNDISAIIAFGGGRVGILWSNQEDEKNYFAVHLDSDADATWQSREVALEDPGGRAADDHLNLTCDNNTGTVVAVVKTSFTGASSPGVVLLKRAPSNGAWSSHTVWTVTEDRTRPIAVLNTDTDSVYVFAKSDAFLPKTIFMKSAHLNNPVFAPGFGTPFIKSLQNSKSNNPTSTKQCATNASGIVVVASDKTSKNYLHNLKSFTNSPPVAVEDSASTNEGTSVTIDVLTNDVDTDGSLDKSSVAIVIDPVHGTMSLNTISGEITYTPNLGFSGPDTLYYSVADDDGQHANAVTVAIRVNDSPTAVNDAGFTSEDTPVSLVVLANDSDPDGQLDVTTVTVVSPPANGNAAPNPTTGIVTYTPNTNFNGTDNFTYTVKDDSGGVSNQAIVTVIVSNVIDPPIAGDDSATLNEDSSAQINVTVNDTDTDGSIDATTVTIVDPPDKGTTVVNPTTGVVTYTPAPDSAGTDSFTYNVKDNDAAPSNTATVTITIIQINDPPRANGDSVLTQVDVPVDILVTANDTDVDGVIDTTSVLASSGDHGSTLSKPDGRVTYIPSSGFFGTDQFTYLVRDDDGAFSDPTTVVVRVNAAPGANDDAAATNSNQAVDITVLANDADPDGPLDSTSVTIVTPPANGTTSISLSSGIITYTPANGFSGTDSFTYQVSDHDGGTSNTATVTVTVNALPIAFNDNATTAEETPVSITVTTNDTDSDGTVAPATVAVVQPPANGQASVNGAGVITYTPVVDFFGFDSLTYTVQDNDGAVSNQAKVFVTVTNINDAPTAVRDTVSTNEDTQTSFDATSNDVDPDNAIASTTLTLGTLPLHGQASVSPTTGAITYAPDLNFFGDDSLTYSVRDVDGAQSNTTTVLLQVVDVNDPPVAGDDSTTTNEDTAVDIDVKSNDSDLDGTLAQSTVTVVVVPTNGTTNVNPATGVITYLPGSNFFGTDSFQYTIQDDDSGVSNGATVTVKVNKQPIAVPDAPTTPEDTPVTIDVTANDVDLDGSIDVTSVSIITPPGFGTAVLAPATGVVTYTPGANFSGVDLFTYTVEDNDGALSLVTNVTVTITAVNDPPVAATDSASTNKNTPAIIDVAANDTDIEGTVDRTTILVVSGPANGSATVNPTTGVVTYMPAPFFFGPDSFSYTIKDDLGQPSAPGVVRVSVDGGNEPPIVAPDNATTAEDTPVNIDVIANDTDIDGSLDASSVTVTSTNNGSTTVNPTTGVVTYTPNPNFFGNDVFTYTVRDNLGAFSNPATVSVTVTAVNDPPSTGVDTFAGVEDVPMVLDVAANDTDIEGTVDTTSTAIVTPPTHGSAAVNPSTGRITYTPAVNFFGQDSLTYTIKDDLGAVSGQTKVFLNIANVNDTPVAVDDAVTTVEEGALAIDVTVNDTDPDGSLDVTTVTVVAPPANGSVTVDASLGTINYTPGLDFVGNDTLTYTVKDGAGAVSNTATVVVTVTPVNDSPVAVDDAVTTPEEAVLIISVISNDSDVDGSIDPGSVAIQSGPNHGSATVDFSNGAITYTPALNFVGLDTLTYSVRDNLGAASNVATVVISVTDVNDLPVAADDSATTPEDTQTVIDVAANDQDLDGTLDLTSVAIVLQPDDGSASVDPVTGAITYTPALNFVGLDTLTYTIKDDRGASSNEARVVVMVTPVNDAPSVVDDLAITDEEVAVTIDVLANDSDVDGTVVPGSVQIVREPSHGTRAINPATGAITYTPALHFAGKDTMGYTVQDDVAAVSIEARVVVTVSEINDLPVAVDDDTATAEETAVEIDVLGNDSDVDGTLVASSIVVASAPGNGTAVVNAGSGTITYTPALDFVGTDSFTYTVQDNSGGNSNSATVQVQVTPVNDPPVAVDDNATTAEETATEIAVTSNDTDVDGSVDASSVVLVDAPKHGSAALSAMPGAITYSPAIDFAGKDTLTYRVRDDAGTLSNTARVVITVTDENDAPVAVNDTITTAEDASIDIGVLANDSDVDGTLVPASVVLLSGPNHGTALVNTTTGTISYTPDSEFFGSDTMTYTVKDDLGLASNVATVFITVTSVNDPPLAQDDSGSTSEEATVELTVLVNDSDVDGTVNVSSVTIVRPPENGTATVNPSGSITYTPGPDFSGADSLDYTVRDDGTALSNVATVRISVTDVNDAPVAADDAVTTQEEIQIDINVTGNDSDVDGTVAVSTVALVRQPSNGSAAVNPGNGAITYTPRTDFFGVDTLSYRVADNLGALSNEAIVVITVQDVNDPPLAAEDNATTQEDVSVNIIVVDNDSDLEGTVDGTTVAVVQPPGHGSTSVNASTGVISYTPELNFAGIDTFSYTIRDDQGALSNEARAIVTVTEINDAPIAVNDTVVTSREVAVDISVLDNDSDVDGTLVTSSLFASLPGNGNVLIKPGGQIVYTPNSGFTGIDLFAYRIQDDDGALSNLATVRVVVTSTPIANNDIASTNENEAVAIEVTANDTDPDGSIDNSTVAITSAPGHGSATVNPTTGVVTYTPAANFLGSDSFTYTVEDNDARLSNAATVTVIVNALPVAVNDTTTTSEETAIAIDVTANDSDPDGNVVAGSVSVATQPGSGSAAVTGTGIITYTPGVDFIGVDTFTYTVQDDVGATSAPATVVVNVTGLNDPPVASPDVVATPEDTPVVINVAANDSDVDGSVVPTSVSVVSQPTNGTSSVDGTSGLVTYTPASNFFGTDSLEYTVKDNAGAVSNAAQVVITVTNVNDGPIAADDSAFTNQGSAVLVQVLANDTDSDGSIVAATVTVVSAPVNGGATVNNTTGIITYTPTQNLSEPDSLKYTVQDDLGALSNVATVYFVINGRPTAVNDAATTLEDTPVAVDVAANDTDPEGNIDVTTVAIATPPSSGSVQVDPATGGVTYSPPAEFSGVVTFTYTISDDQGLTSEPALISILVTDVNDLPVAGSDTSETNEDTPVVISILNNDTDSDGTLQPATVAILSGPASGSAAVDPATGGLTYTPNSNFFGVDSLRYSVRDDDNGASNQALVHVTVHPVNDAPVAVDDSETTSEDTPVAISITVNDTDVDGTVDVTSVAIVSPPASGTVAVDATTGVATYTPNANFSGADVFTYKLSDDQGLTSNTATVSVSVVEQNDVPVAMPDTAQTPEDTQMSINVLSNDSDSDGTLDASTVMVITAPANGQVTIDGTTGAITYTPASNFFGVDSLRYTVKDDLGATSNAATVLITVTPVNDPPVATDDSETTSEDTPVDIAVTQNDTDVEGSLNPGSVTIVSAPSSGTAQANGTTGVVTYAPSENFSGTDTFSYTVADNDGLVSDTATVSVSVVEQNDLPVAEDDTATTPEDVAVTLAVLANDSDSDGSVQASSVTMVAGPQSGSATVNTATGEITYTPSPNFFGVDSLRYNVKDNLGATSNDATVRITVTPVNDAPVAVDDSETTSEDIPVTISVTQNDSDIDGTLDVTTVAVTSGPFSGAANVDPATGVITYTPNTNFFGNDTFTYTVADDAGLTSNTATVSISVVDQNDVPVALDDSVETAEDTGITIAVLANDSDSDGSLDAATVTVLSGPDNGSVALSSGAIVYSPNTNFFGPDSFRYIVKDDLGATSNVATAHITVTSVNDMPVAQDDAATTTEDTPVAISVAQNDSDSDGTVDPGSVTVTSGPSSGTTSVDTTTGVVTYAPNLNFSGSDSFIYTISDNEAGLSNPATVSILVGEDNDSPVAVNDTVTTDEDVAFVVSMLSNDSDSDGTLNLSTLTVISGPEHGSLTLNSVNGVATYIPNSNFFGADSFRYTVKDNSGLTSNVATVLITINAVNDAPLAADDSDATSEDTPVVIAVLANDLDVEGTLDPTSVAITSAPLSGTVQVNGTTGVVTYTPNLNFSGLDQFGYTVKDQDGLLSNVGTVSILVVEKNDGPVAVDDTVATPEDAAILISILNNDSDPDGSVNAASVAVVSGPHSGTASVNGASGEITYTPGTNFFGADSLQYTVKDDIGATSNVATVRLTVAPVNDSPQAIDDTTSTTVGNFVTINVLANDLDPEAAFNLSSVTVATPPSNGSATVNGTTGEVTYVPNSGFTGTDTFGYTVQDDGGLTANEATVTVTVTNPDGNLTFNFEPTDDAQVKLTNLVKNYGSKESSKIEAGIFVSYYKFNISGVSGPVQNVRLRLRIGDAPSDGGQVGGAVHLAANSFQGTATPWVEETLNGGNAPEVLGPALSTLAAVAPSTTVEFDITAAFSGDGTYSFCVQSSSGDRVRYYTKEGLVSPQMVIVVGSGGTSNQPPVAVEDSTTTPANTPVGISVLGNDSDSDGTLQPSTVAIATPPANGTAQVNLATGVINYTPAVGFSGTDTFTYTVQDDEGATSNQATVSVLVASGNTPPAAVADNGATSENTPVTLDVLANDTDDGTLVVSSVVVVTQPGNGTAVASVTTGEITYSPNNSFTGTDSFGYTVQDDGGLTSNEATVTVTVSATGGGTFTFEPTDDGQVKVTNLGKNYGLKSTTKVEAGKFVSYFKFSVTGLNTAVQSAIVRLQVTSDPGDGSDSGGAIHLVSNNFKGTSSPWVEETLNRGNAPEISSPVLSTVGAVSPNQFVEFDVSAAVNGAGVYSFCIQSNSGNQVKYYTKEGATAPQLIINGGAASNQAPVAVNDAAATDENTPVEVDVLGNDSDADGVLLPGSVTIVAFPLNGTATLNGTTGAITYAPDAGFSGTDTFTYTVRDDDGTTSNAATVTVEVTGTVGGQTLTFQPSDDAQVKVTDSGRNYGSKATMKVEAGKFISYLKFNVTGVSGTVQNALVRLRVTSGVSDGSDSGGAIHFVGNNFEGTALPWVEETLNSGNAPQINGAALHSMGAVTPNSLVEFNVTSVVNGDGVYSFCIQSSSGNQVKYYTKEGASLPELIVTTGGGGGTNQPPVAVNDQAATQSGTSVTIDVLSNDSDPDGNLTPSSVAIATAPSNGSAVVNPATGVVTYTSAAGFSGSVTFTYTVRDNDGATSNAGTVTVSVTGGNTAPVASNDNASTNSGTPVTIDVLANDTDESGLNAGSVTIVTPPANGSTTGNSGTGAVTYSPNAGFTGTDSFKYTVQDDGGLTSNTATVTVTVTSSGGGGQTFTFDSSEDGQVKTTDPGRNYGSKASSKVAANKFNSYYKFTVSGLTGTVQSARLRLFVTNGSVDGGSIFSVSNNFANSSLPWVEETLNAGNAPAITGSPLSSAGQVSVSSFTEFDVTLAVAGDGVYSFAISKTTPDLASYQTKEGANSPQLIIQTGGGGSPNNPPVAVDDQATTTAAAPVLIPVLANDSDADGALDASSVTIVTPPSSGTAIVNASSGIVTYTPDPGFIGTVTFRYTVQDDDGATSNQATATVTVNGGGGTQTFTFEPTDDGQVKVTDLGANYGAKGTTKVEASKFKSYLKFSVIGVTGAVQSATLKLRIPDGAGDGSDAGGSVFLVSNNFQGTSLPWVEETLKAGNAPEISGASLSTLGPVSPATFVEFDVTSAIGGNGVFSFAITSTSTNLVKYYTKEGAVAPQLIVQTLGTTAASQEETLAESFEMNNGSALPTAISLKPNYPNPFNLETTIEYDLPATARVEMIIYNARGQEVRKLVNETQQAGFRKTTWNGRNEAGIEVGSGIYFLRMKIGKAILNRKLTLQK